jgi:hypothetical protein
MVKLPDGQCTHSGGETMKKLFTVHFLDLTLIDDSNNGQGSRTWTYANAQQTVEIGTSTEK